jgi:hypothetical protein
MRPHVSADSSAPNAQAGQRKGDIAAHKYEGLTSFQRTSPRLRRGRRDAAARSIIDVHSGIWGSEMGQKKPRNAPFIVTNFHRGPCK